MESPFANAPGSGENHRTQKKPIRETTGRACTETLYKPYPLWIKPGTLKLHESDSGCIDR